MYFKIVSESYSNDADFNELHLELSSLIKHFLQFNVKEECFNQKFYTVFC